MIKTCQSGDFWSERRLIDVSYGQPVITRKWKERFSPRPHQHAARPVKSSESERCYKTTNFPTDTVMRSLSESAWKRDWARLRLCKLSWNISRLLRPPTSATGSRDTSVCRPTPCVDKLSPVRHLLLTASLLESDDVMTVSVDAWRPGRQLEDWSATVYQDT